MSSANQNLLSHIPSVESLIQVAQSEAWAQAIGRRLLVDSIRAAVDKVRAELLRSTDDSPERFGEGVQERLRRSVLDEARRRVEATEAPYYRKVINATGVILHTALGRAVLAPSVLKQIQSELGGYSLLQADVESGSREKRDAQIERLLRQLTGAEAATVVNNNAAATSIVLNSVAAGKEVIVSRGQLVEIGGSFRLPDVMAASGVKLIEVGTTNKTHPRDYENAIGPNTAAILRVHPSNYKISGFTSETSLADLVRIGRERGLVVIDDLGAGPLIDFSRFGFEKEPTLQESLQTGAHLVTASADKLIGASQGGVILGRSDLVQAIRKNPLARILRVGKLTLAALEATLKLFLDEEIALAEIPTLRMLRRPLDEIAAQAERIAAEVRGQAPGVSAETIDGYSQMGSGSLPTQNLATRLVEIRSDVIESGEISARLRRSSPPVFARVHNGRVLLDPRTLLDGEEPSLIDSLVASLSQ